MRDSAIRKRFYGDYYGNFRSLDLFIGDIMLDKRQKLGLSKFLKFCSKNYKEKDLNLFQYALMYYILQSMKNEKLLFPYFINYKGNDFALQAMSEFFNEKFFLLSESDKEYSALLDCLRWKPVSAINYDKECKSLLEENDCKDYESWIEKNNAIQGKKAYAEFLNNLKKSSKLSFERNALESDKQDYNEFNEREIDCFEVDYIRDNLSQKIVRNAKEVSLDDVFCLLPENLVLEVFYEDMREAFDDGYKTHFNGKDLFLLKRKSVLISKLFGIFGAVCKKEDGSKYSDAEIIKFLYKKYSDIDRMYLGGNKTL